MFCKKRPATLLEGWSRVAKFLRKPTLKNVFEWLHPQDGDKLGFYKKVHIKIPSERKDISVFLVIFVLFIYLFIYSFFNADNYRKNTVYNKNSSKMLIDVNTLVKKRKKVKKRFFITHPTCIVGSVVKRPIDSTTSTTSGETDTTSGQTSTTSGQTSTTSEKRVLRVDKRVLRASKGVLRVG